MGETGREQTEGQGDAVIMPRPTESLLLAELATLKAERAELREALSLLLRADEMPPSEQQAGLAIAAMSHARAVLAKGKPEEKD